MQREDPVNMPTPFDCCCQVLIFGRARLSIVGCLVSVTVAGAISLSAAPSVELAISFISLCHCRNECVSLCRSLGKRVSWNLLMWSGLNSGVDVKGSIYLHKDLKGR